MGRCLRCGIKSMQKPAMAIAIFDVLFTSITLILFVMGSSAMVKFEILGKKNNASASLDQITDNIFGNSGSPYDPIREKKDVAQDMGIWVILFFLIWVDFVISCVFLDGVRTRNIHECQAWLNMRWIIIVIFNVIVVINIAYGTSWKRAVPDVLITTYRIIGFYIGYCYYNELLETGTKPQAKDEEQQDNDENESKVPKIKIEVSESRVGSYSICETSTSNGNPIKTSTLSISDIKDLRK